MIANEILKSQRRKTQWGFKKRKVSFCNVVAKKKKNNIHSAVVWAFKQ